MLLQKLCNWLIANKLTLNIQTSNFTLFHLHQKRARYSPKLYIFDSQKRGNARIESKDYIKYPSILLAKHLAWIFHMDTIAGKISKTVDLIAYYITSHRMLDNNIILWNRGEQWLIFAKPQSRNVNIPKATIHWDWKE